MAPPRPIGNEMSSPSRLTALQPPGPAAFFSPMRRATIAVVPIQSPMEQRKST